MNNYNFELWGMWGKSQNKKPQLTHYKFAEAFLCGLDGNVTYIKQKTKYLYINNLYILLSIYVIPIVNPILFMSIFIHAYSKMYFKKRPAR